MRPELPTGKHTLSVLVENKPGVLARVAGLFSRRGFNIDSLAVGPTEHPEVSRMTIVVNVEESPLEQVNKQLDKQVNVIKVCDFSSTSHVERELVLVKVRADKQTRGEVLSVINIFRGKVVDAAPGSYVVEVTGSQDKVRAFVELLEPFGIMEIVRTGVVALYRGDEVLGRRRAGRQPSAQQHGGQDGGRR